MSATKLPLSATRLPFASYRIVAICYQFAVCYEGRVYLEASSATKLPFCG